MKALLGIEHTTLFYKSMLSAALFLLTAGMAHAAELQLSPQAGSYALDDTFTASIEVDPLGESADAVESTLIFDTTFLSVAAIDTTGSAFSFWTTEPVFSNAEGTITFGGGTEEPFSTRETIFEVTFETVGSGETDVIFQDASILATDEAQTNIFTEAVNGSYTIEPQESPEETDTGTTSDDASMLPEARSETFSDPEMWYATTSGTMTWELPSDVTAVAYTVSSSSDTIPGAADVVEPPVSEVHLTSEDLQEGVQYFHLQFKDEEEWGATHHYPIRIDTIPPESFELQMRGEDTPDTFPILVFETTDAVSGVDRYELIVSDDEPVELTPDAAERGYVMLKREDGIYEVSVTAYDKAGNTSVSTTSVSVGAGWTAQTEDTNNDLFFSVSLALKNMLILLFVSVLLFGILYFERRRNQRIERKLREEVGETQEQMEKVFSALRDEIYDEVHSMTKDRRLTKREQNAVEAAERELT